MIAFSRLIQVISCKGLFYKEREKLLIERLNKEINLIVKVLCQQKKIKSELTSKENDGKILINYEQYIVEKESKYKHFLSDKSGVIRKINIKALHKHFNKYISPAGLLYACLNVESVNSFSPS